MFRRPVRRASDSNAGARARPPDIPNRTSQAEFFGSRGRRWNHSLTQSLDKTKAREDQHFPIAGWRALGNGGFKREFLQNSKSIVNLPFAGEERSDVMRKFRSARFSGSCQIDGNAEKIHRRRILYCVPLFGNTRHAQFARDCGNLADEFLHASGTLGLLLAKNLG
jgi:hypothetical protein